MNLRPPLFLHRMLLLAAHAAKILVPLPAWPGDGQPTATFREDGTVRIPAWLAQALRSAFPSLDPWELVA